MALPISECATPKKLSVDIYLQLKTSFILKDDEVNSLKSIQRLRLIEYQVYWWNARKQSIFHTGGSNFASDLRAVKHVRMLLIMFLNSKFICFVELIKFYAFLPKITVLSEMISREMFYFIG